MDPLHLEFFWLLNLHLGSLLYGFTLRSELRGVWHLLQLDNRFLKFPIIFLLLSDLGPL